MKRLVLLRHAKSSWSDPTLTDHDRPLNGRARRTAPAVASELARLGWTPDIVLCSTARRAQETWERMRPCLPQTRVVDRPGLYMGGLEDIRQAVGSLQDTFQTAWLIGHNPGWEWAARELCRFDAQLKTADSVRMVSPESTWPAAAGLGWVLEGHLVARTVDPRGSR